MVVILTFAILFFWLDGKEKDMDIKYFYLKTLSLFVSCSLLASCVAESGKSYIFFKLQY